MTIEAVVFDLDDTLVVEQASVDAAFLATCALAEEKYCIDAGELHQTVRRKARELWHGSPARSYCLSVGISSWEGLWARFEGEDPTLETLRTWSPRYRQETWLGALTEHGVDDVAFAAFLSERFQEERRSRHVVYCDVEPALKKLRGTYKLALLTDGASDLQREKLRGCGLEGHFDVIVISGEVGVGKPQRRIFTLVLDELGVGTEKAVMVGDSLSRDIAGAHNAGLKGIWINRDRRERYSTVVPDYEIQSLGEVHEYLHSLE
ncbi:MAG: HAD family hydrolase [Planctomycetota bacterium]|jgi:putative hydrolase of the HAD superfamily